MGIERDIESDGLLSRDGGTYNVNLSGPEMYEAIKDLVNNLPDKVPAKNITIGIPPLVSSCHDFVVPDLKDAMCGYITPVGYAYIGDIPETKDRLFAPLFHVPKLDRGKTGYYYLRKLTRPQRKAWIKEYTKEHLYIPLVNWLASEFSDMEEFLYSFDFEYSIKGRDYWDNIANAARWNTRRESLSAGKLYDILAEMQDRMNNSEHKFK